MKDDSDDSIRWYQEVGQEREYRDFWDEIRVRKQHEDRTGWDEVHMTREEE